jgi:aerobic carbon-monoxide dehydrogenase small subunit
MTTSTSAEDIDFILNGRPVRMAVEPDESLVETLRRLGKVTVRESCGLGLCGCCAVLVEGVPVSSCLYWSVMVEGKDVVTLEGLVEREDARARALQMEITRQGAAQCGYCTPGMIVTAMDLFDGVQHDEATIRERMCGNLCRCCCYPQLITAISNAVDATEARDATS